MSSKLFEALCYSISGFCLGVAYTNYNIQYNNKWIKPKGWVGYYPSSSGEAIAHPVRSPECDMYHKYPCPKKECRGYQGKV